LATLCALWLRNENAFCNKIGQIRTYATLEVQPPGASRSVYFIAGGDGRLAGLVDQVLREDAVRIPHVAREE